MERAARPMPTGPLFRAATWKPLPLVTLALGALLIARNLAGGGHPPPPASVADPDAQVAAVIQFFEDRVLETRDNLSYNRLTTLYLQRARDTADVSDIRRAEASAAKSLELAPGEYAGLINLALVRLAQHDFAGAKALALRAEEVIPTRADAKALLGDVEIASGRYEAAAEHYRVYLEREPGPAALSRQAALAELHGDIEVAERHWQTAIAGYESAAPGDSAWARVQLGHLYFTAGRLTEADGEFGLALRQYPDYAAALAGRARVAAARGDFAQAIDLYTRVTDRVPAPEAVIALGDVYAAAGRGTDAGRQFALVDAIGQLFATNGIRSDLTLILFAADHGGDPDATLGRAELAYDERPSIQAADVLAWALYRAGRYEEASVRAAEALRFGTKDPLLLFHAGMIAHARGADDDARNHLRGALALNPNFSVQHATEAAATLAMLEGGTL